MAKLFRENILRRNAVPGFACQFSFRITRLRNTAEIHLSHIANFIIVIKYHPPVTGDAEVFEKHISWKNIGCGKLLYCIAILLNNIMQLVITGLFQIKIKRGHSTLDIEMTQNNVVA